MILTGRPGKPDCKNYDSNKWKIYGFYAYLPNMKMATSAGLFEVYEDLIKHV